jgi:hypothetical protein
VSKTLHFPILQILLRRTQDEKVGTNVNRNWRDRGPFAGGECAFKCIKRSVQAEHESRLLGSRCQKFPHEEAKLFVSRTRTPVPQPIVSQATEMDAELQQQTRRPSSPVPNDVHFRMMLEN